MKTLYCILQLFLCSQFCNAQEVGEIKEIKLILNGIPFSGDAIQPNFITPDTSEIFSFNHMDWQDKHVSLFDFFHAYRDSCTEKQLYFNVTMIYIPKEQYKHVRYEGYIPTGEIINQWVLTSIVRDIKEEIESAVDTEYKFNTVISTVYGDLNKDGILDVATVRQDTLHENAPYLLEVFLKQLNGDLQLIVSSSKAIEPQFPDGRDAFMHGIGFDQISIQKGVLWIEVGFIRGHMEHKFRFQNNQFELIGYSYVDVMAGQIDIIDYNLSTGRRIEKVGMIGEDGYKVTMDKIIKLNPLPTLNDFEPFAHSLY